MPRRSAAIDTLPLARDRARRRAALSASGNSSRSAESSPLEQVGSRDAIGDTLVVEPEPQPGGPRSAKNEIVTVDGKQCRSGTVDRHEHDAGANESAPEEIGLDSCSGISYRLREDRKRRLGSVVAAGGYIDCRSKPAALVADRGRGTTQADIAAEEVLISMDEHWTLVGDRRADTIRPDARLAPHCSRP